MRTRKRAQLHVVAHTNLVHSYTLSLNSQRNEISSVHCMSDGPNGENDAKCQQEHRLQAGFGNTDWTVQPRSMEVTNLNSFAAM